MGICGLVLHVVSHSVDGCLTTNNGHKHCLMTINGHKPSVDRGLSAARYRCPV